MKLKAKKREIVGKKVKNLRSIGIIPATIYGPKRKSENIQFSEREFQKIFNKVGFNKFVELTIEDNKPTRALIKEVNYHPLKDRVVDVSIYDIDENRKVTVDIPINLVGESPAVKLKLGFLVHQANTVSVYCLPKDLPDEFSVSIESIEDTSDTISLSDIKLPKNVEFDSSVDPSLAIAYIATDQKEIIDELDSDEEVQDEETDGEEGTDQDESSGDDNKQASNEQGESK